MARSALDKQTVLLSADDRGMSFGIVHFSPDECPRVSANVRIPVTSERQLDHALETGAMWLRNALTALELPASTEIVRIVGPHWGVTEAESKSMLLGMPFTPTEESLKELLAQEAFGTCHVTGCALDGAPMANLGVGEGRHFEVSLLKHTPHEKRGSLLSRAMEKVFGPRGETHYPSTLVLSTVLRDIYGEQDEFAVAEVSRDHTLISLSSDRGLTTVHRELPGSERGVTMLQEALSLPHDQAESLLSLYSRGMLSPRSSEFRTVGNVMDQFGKDWNAQARDLLGNMGDSHLFIAAEPGTVSWVEKTIPKASSYHTVILSPKIFTPHCGCTSVSTDPLLLGSALFLAKLWGYR